MMHVFHCEARQHALLLNRPLSRSTRLCSATCAYQCSSSNLDLSLTLTSPFLQFVSDRESFDTQLTTYVRTNYVREKYVALDHTASWLCVTDGFRYGSLFGCGGVNFQDTSDMYARFTTTVLCNSLVQNAVQDCGLSQQEAEPLCADTCAEFARSEAFITSDNDLCSSPANNLNDLIRADF